MSTPSVRDAQLLPTRVEILSCQTTCGRSDHVTTDTGHGGRTRKCCNSKAMKGVVCALTKDAAPCMRRATSRGRSITAQAASTVVRTPLQSPGIALQLKGLQEFAVATLDSEPAFTQRDVQVVSFIHQHRYCDIPTPLPRCQ